MEKCVDCGRELDGTLLCTVCSAEERAMWHHDFNHGWGADPTCQWCLDERNEELPEDKLL